MVKGRPRQPHQSTNQRQRSPRGHRWIWSLEELESRVLLAPTAFLVDSTASSVSGSGTSGTLPYVVGLANANSNPAGSQISFDSSVFNTPQSINLAGTLNLSEAGGPEVIDATGVSPVTISGSAIVGNPIIRVEPGSNAMLKALTIANGSGAVSGGGIANQGTLTLARDDFNHDKASVGGAIDNSGDLVISDGCMFFDNSGTKSGGAIFESAGTVTIADCTLGGNKAVNGGAIYVVSGSLTINGGTLTGNSAVLHGGGIDDRAGSVKVSGGCNISGNVAGSNTSSGSGGGIYEDGGLVAIGGSAIANNRAVCGGGVYVAGGTLSIAGSTLKANEADEGGAIFQNGGAVKLSASCAVSGNGAQYGGAIVEESGEMSISRSTLSNNTAAFLGGGIYASFGSLTIGASTLSGNKATAGGGLFDFFGNVQLRDSSGLTSDSAHDDGGAIDDAGGAVSISASTVSNNKAAEGGGVLVATGMLTISASTLSGNTAFGNGGGVAATSGTLKLSNSSLSDNKAATSGGGVFLSGGALSVNSVTIAYNGVDNGGSGGGLDIQAGSATLDNTIIALNVQGSAGDASDIAGVAWGSYNLIGTGGSGGLMDGENGNIVGVADPGLAPLGDYGGPTETIALLPGSPAIGSGSGTGYPSIDQRGVIRPVGSFTDIGAFESRGFMITVTGGNGQATQVNTGFLTPLQVTVSSAYDEPVAGGVVTFSAPGLSATATLSSGTATILAGGVASVTATANGPVGEYSVTTSASGAATSVSFSLSNDYQPAFSGLTSQTITYGTSLATISGTVDANAQIPAGDEVIVTLDGVAEFAPVGNNGSFSATVTTASLAVAGSPYTVNYNLEPTGSFLGANETSQLSVTAAALTITAESASKTYGQVVTLAGSGFTEHGLVNGDTITGVTLTSVGSAATATVSGSPYAIVPSGAAGTGLGNYAISYVDGSLTVQPAPLTITADSTSKTYGNTVTFAGNQFTESGLVNGDTITGVTLTSSGAVATATVSRSPYAIVPSAAAGTGLSNYTIRYASGSLTIHPAALTITADSTSKTYGQTVTLTNTGFTASGLVNGDEITGVSLTSSGAAATATVAGSPYAIVPSNAVGTGLDNYAITYVAGMLTITPAPLTIVANSESTSFGGTVPALTASFVGFVNGNTPASLTTPLELATSATSNSPAGNYAITIGGASSPDYTISYLGGNVTVNPYVPPTQSRYRAAAAFVTTLYAKLGGGPPEPVPFMFWMDKYLGHQSPMNITRAFARSITTAISGNDGSAPKVSLRVACNDAQAAARRAAR